MQIIVYCRAISPGDVQTARLYGSIRTAFGAISLSLNTHLNHYRLLKFNIILLLQPFEMFLCRYHFFGQSDVVCFIYRH